MLNQHKARLTVARELMQSRDGLKRLSKGELWWEAQETEQRVHDELKKLYRLAEVGRFDTWDMRQTARVLRVRDERAALRLDLLRAEIDATCWAASRGYSSRQCCCERD